VFDYLGYQDWLNIPNVDDFLPRVAKDGFLYVGVDGSISINSSKLREYLFKDIVDNTFIEYKNSRITFDYYKLLDVLRSEFTGGGGDGECSYEESKENNPYWKQSLNMLKVDTIMPLEGIVNLTYIPRGDIAICEVKDPSEPDGWLLRDDLVPSGVDTKRYIFRDGLPSNLDGQMVRLTYLY